MKKLGISLLAFLTLALCSCNKLPDIPVDPDEHAGGTESGLYLGIIGFNTQLYYLPIGILKEKTKPRFYEFIDGLEQDDDTMLYYSVRAAIRKLQLASYPSNLSSASIVTFTDGVDNVSTFYDQYKGTNEAYLAEVNKLLYGQKVVGLPLSAWTVGLLSEDAESQESLFAKNLEMLSKPESQGVLARDMDGVNVEFKRIARNLNNSFNINNVEITIAGPSNGMKVRFTLDGASSAEMSNMYVEGVFNMNDLSLKNVEYYGMTSSSGKVIKGVRDNNRVTFSFEGIRPDSDSVLDKNMFMEWRLSESENVWQRDSEFKPTQAVSIKKVQQSAVVLLNLDCTTSLTSRDRDWFPLLKQSAKSFISLLCEMAADPSKVASVSLDTKYMKLYAGDEFRLHTTIMPTTAEDKRVVWTTSDSRVATVSNGLVKAVGPGTALITATTVDEGCTDECEVIVRERPAVEAVDLGLSVRWASWNVGASAPEEYGDYYAWGETAPKEDYNWSTYKWCNGSFRSLTKYNTKSSYGTWDNKLYLDLADDAANSYFGRGWRMPTNDEWSELRDNCTWKWTDNYKGTGVAGMIVTSNIEVYNNRSIFLPAAGARDESDLVKVGTNGYYWSSSLSAGDPAGALSADFYSGVHRKSSYYRYYGFPVRPVID